MAPELAWDELPESQRPLKVLDPMTGSGTTLVAARLRGHHAVGFDMDPLAVLIAGAWVSDLEPAAVMLQAENVLKRARRRAVTLTPDLAYPAKADEETKKFITFWFDCENRVQLCALSASIGRIKDENLRGFLWCAFSRLIITKTVGVSLAMDVSHSRPHKVYDKAPYRAFDRFLKAVQQIIKLSPFALAGKGNPAAEVLESDARQMPLKSNSIDFIITSPPYLNAIDYLRGHKLSLVWMGHSIQTLRKLRSSNVGSETRNSGPELDGFLSGVFSAMCSGDELDSKSAGMLERYLLDLKRLLSECFRVVRRGGKAVFVLGDCNIKKTFVSNSKAVELICRNVGFEIHSSRRRPLPENRRYLPPPATKSSGASLQKRMREEVILTVGKPLRSGIPAKAAGGFLGS